MAEEGRVDPLTQKAIKPIPRLAEPLVCLLQVEDERSPTVKAVHVAVFLRREWAKAEHAGMELVRTVLLILKNGRSASK